MEDRYLYLKRKHPDYRIQHGKVEVNKSKLIKRTSILEVKLDLSQDIKDTISLLREYKIRYPQFIKLSLEYITRISENITLYELVGIIRELDSDQRLRIKKEEELSELYDLIKQKINEIEENARGIRG